MGDDEEDYELELVNEFTTNMEADSDYPYYGELSFVTYAEVRGEEDDERGEEDDERGEKRPEEWKG